MTLRCTRALVTYATSYKTLAQLGSDCHRAWMTTLSITVSVFLVSKKYGLSGVETFFSLSISKLIAVYIFSISQN